MNRLDWLYSGTSIEVIQPPPLPMQMLDSIAEQVKKVIDHPACFMEVMESFVNFPDIAQIEFLDLLLKENKTNSEVIFQCVVAFVRRLSSPVLTKLLEENPQLFLQLLTSVNSKQAEQIMRHLISHVKNWKSLLQNIFKNLSQTSQGMINSPQDVPAGHFIHKVFSCLPHRCQKQWIKFCTSELPEVDWAFFMLSLDKKARTFSLNYYISFMMLDLTKDGLFFCIEALAQQINYPDLVRLVLHQILNKFYVQKQTDIILDQFNQLSLHAQICLLDAMSYTQMEKIFFEYSQNFRSMVAWMNGLFHYRSEFSHRKVVIQCICNKFETEKLIDLLEILIKERSQIGPYLLFCFSKQKLQQFVYDIPYYLRSELLSFGTTDSTKLQILHAINALPDPALIERMTINMENSTIPVDSRFPLNLKQCFDVLKQVAFDKELAADYSSFIEKIPPILVGILAFKSENRHVLIELAPLLTEAQLKYFICPLTCTETCDAIEQKWSSFSPDQFTAIFEGLSAFQFSKYVKFKTDQLQIYYKEFLQKYQDLQQDLEIIKPETEITMSLHESLQQRANALCAIIRRAAATDFHILSNFLQQPQSLKVIDSEVLNTLTNTLENLKNKRILFEGKHAIMTNRILNLEERIMDRHIQEEVDLTEILYTRFWTFVREGTLPYLNISSNNSPLGISHAGQLTLVGIQSNADLEHLGASEDELIRFEHITLELEKLVQTGQQKFRCLWEKFCEIKLEDPQLKLACNSILEFLNVDQMDPLLLKSVTLGLYQKLIQFKHISGEDHQFLLEGSLNSQVNISIIKTHFEYGLFMFRRQHPLFCLQRYLINPNLRTAWQIFNSKGCMTISSLYEKQYVKQTTDLLRLEEIAKSLS